MQQLHLVGFTTDLEGLIFSVRKGSKSGSFVVPVDDALLATIEDARRMRDGDPGPESAAATGGMRATGDRRPRPESTLSPREIQARLRAGSSIAEVAEAAGVDEDWVLRFAVPILAEQQQVVDRARQLVYSKARLGPSAQPLGTSVLWNLVDRGLRMTEAAWDAAWRAWNLHGAVWVVQFAYVSRQRSQNAEWEVDLREGALHARNRLAADLGYIEPGRRRRSQALFEPPDDVPVPAARSSKRAPAGATSTAGKAGGTSGRPGPAKRAAGSRAAGASATQGRGNRASTTAKGAAGQAKGVKKASKATASKAAASKASASKSTAAGRRAGSAKTGAGAAAARSGARSAAKRGGSSAGRTSAKAAGRGSTSRGAGGDRGTVPGKPATKAGARPVALAEERVSHLARPLQLPERRGAARDGTPVESNATRPVTAMPRGQRGLGSAAPAAGRRTAEPVAGPPPRPRGESATAVPPRPRREPDVARPAPRAVPEPAPARAVSRPAPAGQAPRARAEGDPGRPVPAPPAPEGARPARPQPEARRVAAGEGPPRRQADTAPARARADAGRADAEPARSRADTGSTPSARRAGAADAAAVEERPRIERQRGRPAPPEPAPTERARRSDRPVVPPPPVTESEDGTVVVRRRQQPPADRAGNGARPDAGSPPAANDERLWHGPGSGEAPPPVRIRADLAAAASANAEGARRTRRSAGRERPLRAR